ncbi:hypothetical protein [Amycolatopsis taiwanensis]|uniref:Uncharacterized protein n=1 Tax=Amycolatopsis taiwanensis TaxID=342230 RepID=A0A9W6VFX8_9PSEU|nr:hypothetical protein [Amycolatopsis taiwanensis]GLY65947.1 hypothetical protein Atai01_25660 [Amycolatopsis taiwanensis]
MDVELNHRERATLKAVASGHAEITCSSEPDLFFDGLTCCDQTTAHRLANLGLIAPAHDGRPGERVPAVLTDTGRAAFTALSPTLARASNAM